MNLKISISSDTNDYMCTSLEVRRDKKLKIFIEDLSHEDSELGIHLTEKQALVLRDFLLLAYPKE